MSSIKYREWDIFINNDILNQEIKIYGYFECVIFNTIMVKQTLEFLNKNFKIDQNKIIKINSNIPEIYYPQLIINRDGELYLRIYRK